MLVTRLFNKKCFQSSINMLVRSYHVTVMGGASEIGQIVSLMLRSEPLITKLVVHDMRAGTPGVVQDLSHIPFNAAIQGHYGGDSLNHALKDADLVLFTGGAIITPGITYKDFFETNCAFVQAVAAKVGKMPQMPFVGIVTDPINILVPMAAEIMRNNGAFDAKKLFGITSVDWLRAQTLYAEIHQYRPQDCLVPVIGGHSELTTVPLISHSTPAAHMETPEIVKFTTTLQNCGNIVTEAKQGWSPTMSVAHGVLLFTRAILAALEGQTCTVSAYVDNNDFGTSFFSGLVKINKDGIIDMQRYTNLSKYECDLLEVAVNHIRKDVAMGRKVLELT